MPFIPLPEHGIHLHYRTSRPQDGIDPSLPTLVCIPQTTLSLDVFSHQLESPSLSGYNVVAMDTRAGGKTRVMGDRERARWTERLASERGKGKGKERAVDGAGCGYGEEELGWEGEEGEEEVREFDEEKDVVTTAEEIAAAMEYLSIPSAFLLGDIVGSNIALWITVLFPDKVLGLVLTSPGTPYTDPPEVKAQIYDLRDLLLADKASGPSAPISDESIDIWYHMYIPLSADIQILAPTLSRASYASMLQETFGPGRPADVIRQAIHILIERPAMEAVNLKDIRVPVMLLAGDRDVRDEMGDVARLSAIAVRDSLTGAKGGVSCVTIRGSGALVVAIPQSTRYIASFLDRHR